MRGTVLLLESDGSKLVDVELLRASGLMIHHAHDLAQALEHLEHSAPDVVVVAALPARQGTAIVSDLRQAADAATSIIVVSVPEDRDAVRKAGADSFHNTSGSVSDLLYEIHRALILRRSARRLPWNG
jgi:DNA-binding response OmpR family regulator